MDIKEAYEFSILNSFLVNEEDLNNLISDLNSDEVHYAGGDYVSGSSQGGMLELHNNPDAGNNFVHTQSSEEDDYPENNGGGRSRIFVEEA